MHELAVCQALVEQLEGVAAEHRAHAVASLVVGIGPLSGVEPDLLQRAFPLASADSVAAGAELLVEVMPIRVRCQTCGAESGALANRLVCGACGDWKTDLLSGDELLLNRVELLTPDEEEAEHV